MPESFLSLLHRSYVLCIQILEIKIIYTPLGLPYDLEIQLSYNSWKLAYPWFGLNKLMSNLTSNFDIYKQINDNEEFLTFKLVQFCIHFNKQVFVWHKFHQWMQKLSMSLYWDAMPPQAQQCCFPDDIA